ncbi:MAG TPA: glutamine--fructose-6-phosphate transaminase (isomerizing) [Fimbriimonadaceae bacterium]|nr:glutamine--fructose-6-phosphate transaminase (isomerizing) [Fimbriimonadaceae bacterium]
MCGIAGYVGPKDAVSVVIDQLKRLEYRGYDSAGTAWLDGGTLHVVKKAGKLAILQSELGTGSHHTTCAMAHSRWATHGGPTDANAHPHCDNTGKIAVIHNGIIENYLELREEMLREGHVFKSETDTEVAAHLIGQEFAEVNDLDEAVRRAVRQMRGAYALVVVATEAPDHLVAARKASPLVLGIGEGEMLLASDIPALLPYTREVVVMPEDSIASLRRNTIELTDLDGRTLPVQPNHIAWNTEDAERGGYPHFMLKEIHEQPEVMRNAMAGRIDEDMRVVLSNAFSDSVWHEIDRINIVGCGTAYHAGLMGKHLFERLLRLPTDVYYSSEFRYGDPVLSPRSLAIFISQSGETMDTLAALRVCKARRLRTLGIVNVMGSSLARECDRTLLTNAGPEISVCSTKAYTAQVMVLTLLALYIAQVQEAPGIRVDEWVRELRLMPDYCRKTMDTESQVKDIAEKLKDMPMAFFFGRGADAYAAYEGALKLKEIAYIPTEDRPAGEMKHGPLALVQPGVVCVVGATQRATLDKVISNVREVQARGGTAVAITSDQTDTMHKVADHCIQIPATEHDFFDTLLSTVPLQLFAYYVAAARGCDIDQPRNLAKSVTVE